MNDKCPKCDLKSWYIAYGDGPVLAVADGSQPVGTSLLYRKVEADQVINALEAKLDIIILTLDHIPDTGKKEVE